MMENNEIKTESVQEASSSEGATEKISCSPLGGCCANVCKYKKYILGVIVLLLIVGFAVYQKNPGKFAIGKIFTKNLSKDEAKAKVIGFIEGNLVAPGTKIEVKDIEDMGLYKMTVVVSGQELPAYISKDGTKFFPQAMDIAEITKQAQDAKQANEVEQKEVPKADIPEVKLFVMSYCPYGIEVERGIMPVLATLGKSVKYSLEFVGYAMHGDKEIAENLRQYCIQKTQPAKLSNYLKCFLKKGEGTSDACMKATGVSPTAVSGCVAQTDAKFNVSKDAADKAKWLSGKYPPFNVNKDDVDKYAVQGSPALIINDVEVDTAVTGRDSASLLKTICAAFKNQPKACSEKLSSDKQIQGFGDGKANTANQNAAPASCGTPAQ